MNHFQKELTPHPLKILEHPDKKRYSLGIILIPSKNLKPLEKYQPSLPPPPNKKRKLFIPLNKLKFNTTEKIPTPLENISDTSENISTPPEII